jgi:hypothetical protein
MKGKELRRELTNIFEIALHQEFRKLQLGEPDSKVRKAIDKASKKVTSEVKRFMKEQQKLEEKRRKQELKKMRKEDTKKVSGKAATTKTRRSVRQSDIVENILA